MKFKTGDEVKIVKNSGKHPWNPEGLMDRTLGQIGKMVSKWEWDKYFYIVSFKESQSVDMSDWGNVSSWVYHEDDLELVYADAEERDKKFTFKVGDRVVLRADSRYIETSVNPKVGSKYFCEGTIESIVERRCILPLKVKWDNGTDNEYRENQLDLADKTFSMTAHMHLHAGKITDGDKMNTEKKHKFKVGDKVRVNWDNGEIYTYKDDEELWFSGCLKGVGIPRNYLNWEIPRPITDLDSKLHKSKLKPMNFKI